MPRELESFQESGCKERRRRGQKKKKGEGEGERMHLTSGLIFPGKSLKPTIDHTTLRN